SRAGGTVVAAGAAPMAVEKARDGPINIAAAEKLPALYEVLNLANDQVWDGGFTFWGPQKLMKESLMLVTALAPTIGYEPLVTFAR
ncbi:hypothetical protein VB636_02025, partial [Paracoccus sp. APAP_BH8]